MAGFEDLGLNERLVANAREEGFDAPTALQRSVIPVIRRGGNVIIRASSGAGMTAAYALALIDKYSDADDTRALVIVPTSDRAERAAGTIARLAHGTMTRVSALTSAWSARRGAGIVVASAERLNKAIEESQLKLDGVETVVIDGAASIAKLTGESVLETILGTVPRDGQRVFITSEMTDSLRKLTEAHARKALHFPARPAVEEGTARPEATTSLQYLVAGDAEKADAVARFARQVDGPIVLVCRSESAARRAERELRGRGYDASAFSYDEFDRNTANGRVIGYDAPFAADQLSGAFRSGDVVVVERSELAHVRQLGEESGAKFDSARMPAYEPDSLNAFRNEIRRAAREEDLDAQLLVLAPLFDELSPEEVAAAASALLRARKPMKTETAVGGGRPGMKTWARLFFSVGERDGVRAGDMVGAITGESGIKGEDVGKVEIRDTFSVVEVAATAADKVIRSMNGTTMKNRALRVDYDRKTASGPGRGGSGRPAGGRRVPTKKPR